MKTTINRFYIFLLSGVICMLNSCSYVDGFKYARYSGKDPELNLTVDYISNWISREHKGPNNSYVSVLFFEDTKDKDFKARMVVTVSGILQNDVKPLSLDEKADNLVTGRLKFKDANLLSKSKTILYGLEAMDIVMGYKAMNKLNSTDGKLIPVKEKMVIFNKNNKLYFLRYEGSLADFNKYLPAFTHMLKSLKFKADK